MLEEKKVSATSTWERELSKIVFDSRYLLLTASERRAAFEAYQRERSEVEKVERKKKSREAREGYQTLLEEADLHGKSTFEAFINKHGKDARFKAVDRMRDREDMFMDFTKALYKKEKEDKKVGKETAVEKFKELLTEHSEGLHSKSKWSKLKKKIHNDDRYKDKYLDSKTREQLYSEFATTLPPKVKDGKESVSP